MELKISKISYDARLFDYGTTGAKLKIRPYPASKNNFIFRQGGGMVLSGENSFDKFAHCLVDWEGFGEDGKPIPLTDEVKKKVFDFQIGKTTIDGEEITLSAFVIQKADELAAEMGELEKN